jgi:2-polyprenyl-3-methyl-5-hydroxy-6-metoxy-1,4-benzoquinol methylase
MKNSHMKYVAKRDEKNPLVPGHYFLFNWVKPYLTKNAKVLDIGCWSGALEMLFEKEKFKITGIDIEEEPLKYASKRFPKFRFKQANIVEKLPFRKGEFDAIMYFMVLEHIPKGTEEQSLKNLNKVMKMKGNLFMNTMHNNFRSNLFDPAYIKGHRHYRETELKQYLKKTGFSIKEIKYNGGYFTTFHIVMLYFFKHVLRRNEPRNRFFDYLMGLDYRDQGFTEIDIHAVKIKEL